MYVDEEAVNIQVHENDNLISIAHMLKELGHEVDVVLPHIQVSGAWISEQEALDTTKEYHFCKYVCWELRFNRVEDIV